MVETYRGRPGERAMVLRIGFERLDPQRLRLSIVPDPMCYRKDTHAGDTVGRLRGRLRGRRANRGWRVLPRCPRLGGRLRPDTRHTDEPGARHRPLLLRLTAPVPSGLRQGQDDSLASL